MTPPQPTWQENKGARWFIIPQIHTEPVVLLTLYLTIVDKIGASSFFQISHWNLSKNTLNYQRKFYVRVSSHNPPFPDQLFNCHRATAFSKQQVPNSCCDIPKNKSVSKCEDYDIFLNLWLSHESDVRHGAQVTCYRTSLMRSYKRNLLSLPHVDEWKLYSTFLFVYGYFLANALLTVTALLAKHVTSKPGWTTVMASVQPLTAFYVLKVF